MQSITADSWPHGTSGIWCQSQPSVSYKLLVAYVQANIWCRLHHDWTESYEHMLTDYSFTPCDRV